MPAPELMSRTWAFSKASWPDAAHNRSWRSYFRSLEVGALNADICSSSCMIASTNTSADFNGQGAALHSPHSLALRDF